MKKLSLFILLVSLVCLVGLLAACDTGTPAPQDPCANGHTEVADAAVPASCTEAGLTAGSHCSVCNKILTAQKRTDLIAHTEGEWVDQIVATCLQTGVREKSCTVCNTVLATETVAGEGHDFDPWRVVTAATCKAKGEESRSCKLCQLTETREIRARQHMPGGAIVDRAATCTAEGLQHFICVQCGVLVKEETIPTLSHQYGEWAVTTPATCKESGKKQSTCEFCGHSKTEELEQISHDTGDWIVDLEATCTTEGSRHKFCSLCESVVLTQKLDAKGHSLGSLKVVETATCSKEGLNTRTCSVCGYVQEQVVPTLSHIPTEWVIDAPATCTATGVRHQSCSVCEMILTTEDIPVRDHQYGAWQAVHMATCQTTGLSVRTCAICEKTESQTQQRLAHQESDWIVDVAATCTEGGAHHKSCTMCGILMAERTVSALGHLNENWTVITPPTCISQGEEARGCTRCDASETRPLATVAHTEPTDWIVDVEPTCATRGSRHKECQECQSILRTETIETTAHTPAEEWTVTVMPTASMSGTSAKLCTICAQPAQTTSTRLEYGSAVSLSQKTSIALNGYSVIYNHPIDASASLITHLNRLCDALKTATGATFTQKVDASTAVGAKEILIGLTNRAESRQVYASLSGRAFTVRTVGDKIVILGTDETLTLAAVQYFINRCLGSSATVTMSVETTACDLVARPLAPSTGSNYVYVQDADLDRDNYHMYVSDSYNNAGYPGDGRDYPVYLFEKLIAQVAVRSSLGVSAFPDVIDTDKTHQNGYELLFGEVDRVESRAFRDILGPSEYGFCVWGNKVIVTAHTDAGLEKALEAFLTFYDYLLESAHGVLPQGYAYIDAVTDKNWITDFPQPEGVRIENAQNNNDDSIQIIYTGLGADGNASLDSYEKYCTKLTSNGYTLVQKSDNPGNTGSYFRLYKNTATSHVLYVAYNAYSAQEEYAKVYKSESAKYGDFIHYHVVNSGHAATQYPLYTYKQCIRVVSAPLTTAYLPDASLLTQQDYVKVVNSSITAMRLMDGDVGMGYILQLEDGRFIIVDGGSYHSENYTREILYETLSELHKRATGAAPSESNPLHIAAWLVTHSHGDHYVNMNSFLSKYVPKKVIKMDYLIGNFPEVSTIYPVGSDTTGMGGSTRATMLKHFTDAGVTPFKYVKVHTGMSLYFANLKMEIVMTYEDHAPFRITNSNDTNTVTKWTIASSDAASGKITASTAKNDPTKTTWMMLGDSCIYASRWMCAMWGGTYNASTKYYDGSYLKTDMVQLAHHGNIGCEVALYKTIQAAVVWFPHNSKSYNGYTQNGKNTWQRHVDNTTINLSCVEYIVVSGINSTSTSYTDSITISFNKDGIYFPESGSPAWGIKFNKTTQAVTVTNIAYNYKSSKTAVSNSPVIKKNW